MGSRKNYNGYNSFQYLETGKDFKEFKLVKQIGRVTPYLYPLSSDEEDRALRLIEKYITISLHDHSHVHPIQMEQIYDWIRSNRISTGYEGLAASGLDAIFDGLMDGTNRVTSNVPWTWDSLIAELGMRLSDISHQDFVTLGKRVDDIKKAHKEGKLAFVPHVEGAMPIANDIDRVDILYGFGVRCMGLVYSESNALGSGLRERRDSGLTDFGSEVVKRMNKIGMAIDLAHVGDQTSLDAIEESNVPVFITHSGSRTVWPTKRMKPDNVLQALSENGGVIGIEAAPHTTISDKHKEHSLESFMDHFQYVQDLIGIDHVTFGPDTLFGDHVGIHHFFANELSIQKSHEGVKFNEVEYVKGIENPSEYPNIIRWMVHKGYSDSEIEKAVGLNTLKVLEKVWR